MPDQPAAAATSEETLADLLREARQRRSTTAIRRAFLQDPRQRSRPGPLADIVRAHRGRALDLLLLLHCGAAADPWDVTLPAMAWARALGMPQTTSSETTISKNWTWLEEQGLVRSQRVRRLRQAFLLKEDGSGAPYTRPRGEERGFFRLPFAYFLDGWHRELRLPGKAMLLVCLAQKPTFILSPEHATVWYGLSPDTMQRGLDELVRAQLLKVWMTVRTAPRARHGLTQVLHYQLLGAFER